jgi:hypothetical protein
MRVIIILVEVEMSGSYEEALKKAQQELAEADAEAEKLEKRRASLRQTVSVLQMQMGIDIFSSRSLSLTEAIVLVVKGSPGYVTVKDVMDRLFALGYSAQTPSVATILSRLHKHGKIESLIGPNRMVGYGWKTETTKADRQTGKRVATRKDVKRSS